MIGEIIEKEHIGDYKIIPAAVDKTDSLHSKLLAAQRLGNEFKSKTTMVFQTEDGPKRIETTVWSLTEQYVQIKAGVLIPLKSIIEVDF
ncbi:hypothetical protein BC792_104173 [Sphingobacterium allocomposti]|jgi:hypothetical protein|uniref:Uncharacterized protein n=1 Tax=Sphingobacterium allocomposti TaxID=415956 RepID=A0A5S5DPJ0_9SPHI|nr:hypothetical protein [Sphingobacterium composti Yoo et al. 2007 non Ten et al. 2007]TYP96946.1 hypothetical protein BC792_104173 [Sphingobacterium composti Yoo et al. 2007 non Ten et al. 2007]HLS96985.1 hypothetical protein [Sphingobacterium sp.]